MECRSRWNVKSLLTFKMLDSWCRKKKIKAIHVCLLLASFSVSLYQKSYVFSVKLRNCYCTSASEMRKDLDRTTDIDLDNCSEALLGRASIPRGGKVNNLGLNLTFTFLLKKLYIYWIIDHQKWDENSLDIYMYWVFSKKKITIWWIHEIFKRTSQSFFDAYVCIKR